MSAVEGEVVGKDETMSEKNVSAMTMKKTGLELLKVFCAAPEDDPIRPALHDPFSWGGWTYATEGRVLVRVPRLAEVPENPIAPKIDEAKEVWMAWRLVGKETVWEALQAVPPQRDGEPEVYRRIGERLFNLELLRKVACATGVEIAPHVGEEINIGMPFRFEGGVGLVMPLNSEWLPESWQDEAEVYPPAPWRAMSTAPKAGYPIQHIRVKMADGSIHEDAHWASDLSGEEQPAFEGWFVPSGAGFHGIDTPIAWMPMAGEAVGT